MIQVFTDGACLGNPGPGGWAALLVTAEKKETLLSGHDPDTTNNRMELMAVIQALGFLKTTQKITVYTDSQYVKNGITVWIKSWRRNSWRTSQGKPVKNQDLWERLDHEAKRLGPEWQWVKGHSGHPENDRVDAAAQKAARQLCG